MRAPSVATVLLGVAALACSDATAPDAGRYVVTVLSGNEQVGVQHELLPQPVVIEAAHRDGVPLAGARLTLTPGAESGVIAEADSVTDDLGQARFTWVVGTAWANTVDIAFPDHPGATVQVRARARYRYTTPEEAGDGWQTAPVSAVGMAEEPLAEMMDSIRSGGYTEVHAVIIVKDHRLVVEAYFPGHDFNFVRPSFHGAWVDWGRYTRHNTHSATKSMASALVGLAIDRGLLASEDERIFDFFPDYADYAVGWKADITVRDLLTMTSGLEWHEWDTPLGMGQNDLEQMNYALDPIGFVLAKPLAHEPGTVFNYNGGTVNVLCQIVARAAGTEVDQFADSYLFGPLGVGNYSFPRHASGTVLCHGDIHIAPRDMAKFGQLFLQGGVWEERRIISQEWVRRSVLPSVSVRDFRLTWADEYGYLWWLKDYLVGGTPHSAFKALGWGGQEIWVMPDEDLVVVFTGANYVGDPPTQELMTRFILPALGG